MTPDVIAAKVGMSKKALIAAVCVGTVGATGGAYKIGHEKGVASASPAKAKAKPRVRTHVISTPQICFDAPLITPVDVPQLASAADAAAILAGFGPWARFPGGGGGAPGVPSPPVPETPAPVPEPAALALLGLGAALLMRRGI